MLKYVDSDKFGRATERDLEIFWKLYFTQVGILCFQDLGILRLLTSDSFKM